MSSKPIFVATHPRACSTAFERVFMTCRDTLACVHEPFGDAFYYGQEIISQRFMNDEKTRKESGYANSTYKTICESLVNQGSKGKRLFIKDMAYYLVPPDGQLAQIAPSLGGKAKKGVGTNGYHHMDDVANGITNGLSNGINSCPYPYNTESEPGNPTVVPSKILEEFHFAFLIRHPRHSIPSYYRCTIPPLDAATGFYNFMPNEAGYDELRRLFEYLESRRFIGPALAGQHEGQLKDGEISIMVIDADDLLDNPYGIIEAFCKEVGISYTPAMLNWDSERDQQHAKDSFEKWKGFHNDALSSSSLKPRSHAHEKRSKTIESENKEWQDKFGVEAQKMIRECVDKNLADYEYLKSFAIKV